MVKNLSEHMKRKDLLHIKTDSAKLMHLPMHEWYAMNDGSKIMRAPGVMIYNVKDKELFTIPFKGVA